MCVLGAGLAPFLCADVSLNNDDVTPFVGLEIKRANSLKKALKQFTASEQLDGNNLYTCEGCKQKVQCIKQLKIHRAPTILTCHLKRYALCHSAAPFYRAI